MPSIQRGGQRIHYEVEGSGPPVLLAHSFLCSIAMWQPQIDALRDRFTLIAVDARGHGESGPAQTPFDMWDSAEDHLAVLDALEIESAAWAGLSMGGMAGLRAALRHPTRIASLVLLDTDGGAETAFVRTKYVGMLLVARTLGIAPLLGAVTSLMFGATTRSTNQALVAEWTERWRGLHVPSMLGGIKAIAGREDLLGRLDAIGIPVMVIVGSEDRALPPSRARRLAAALGGVPLHEVPGAGHLSTLEQPAEVSRLMGEFLAGPGCLEGSG